MDHAIIKAVIADMRAYIKNASIVDRHVVFEAQANYVITGIRQCGKSFVLYKKARDLVDEGADWNDIIYINFEDDRLAEFVREDFSDLVEVAEEISSNHPIYFLDEVQIVDDWASFARRLKDQGQRVYITGSNSKMLSREIEVKLGGRYLSKEMTPYSFAEFLSSKSFSLSKDIALLSSEEKGKLNGLLKEFFTWGGFPALNDYSDKRGYLESTYQKIYIGDIATRNEIRNIRSLRVLYKKMAEVLKDEVSYTKLFNVMKGIGFPVSKDTIIDYISYAEEAYLIFELGNYYGSFEDKETTPKYYFSDNGLLSLFLNGKEGQMLENLIAVTLHRAVKEDLYFIKSSKTGIDVDFYLPETGLAIQACYSLSDLDFDREVDNLVKLSEAMPSPLRLVVVTYEQKKTLNYRGKTIEVIPLLEFLLNCNSLF
ncbi:MAG: ATP-binding protein [Bacilli bacterium]|jgi:predicted AAA+ superfamily ATPase|nr:ATP-binding protein [Bacilli bacterium]